MTIITDRFCTECGGPLSPGDRFCGECGRAVTSGTPVPAAGPGTETIRAVLPFCSRPKGFLGSESVSVVFTTRRLIPVVWDPQLTSILGPLQKRMEEECYEMERQGRDPVRLIAPLVFDPGTVFPPWDQLFPDPGGKPGIDLRDIEYIRGEQSDSAHYHEDLLIISTAGGEQELYVEAGWYSATSSRLLHIAWDGINGPAEEKIVGVVPLCSEPEREGFGFSYSFSLVVTTGRIIYAFISDAFADIHAAYLRRLMEQNGKNRRRTGKKVSEEVPVDAPWQEYARRSPETILSDDPVNFYIPISMVGSVTIIMGENERSDLLVIALPSHEERLELDPGFGDLACDVFSRAMGEKVKKR